MARLHHVRLQTVVAQRSTEAPATGGPSWKASHPIPHGAVEPWFQLTPRVPSIDTRVGRSGEVGVAAVLECFGAVTGPSAMLPGGTEASAVLGGQPAAPGTPAPAAAAEFGRHSHVKIAVDAEGLSSGRQCLLVIAVRGLGTSERAAVQIFAGTAFVGEDQVQGEDRLAVLLDVPDHGRLAIDLRLRLVGGLATRLAIHGVDAHLL